MECADVLSRKEKKMGRAYTVIWRPDEKPWEERRVHILPPGGHNYAIDPRQEIELRTCVILPDRKGCVVSMADGFQAAGMRVQMRSNRNGIRTHAWHVQRFEPVAIYWFLGYCLAQNRWGRIKRVLEMLPVVDRFTVYQDSAYEFFSRRRGKPADLVAPLGIFLK